MLKRKEYNWGGKYDYNDKERKLKDTEKSNLTKMVEKNDQNVGQSNAEHNVASSIDEVQNQLSKINKSPKEEWRSYIKQQQLKREDNLNQSQN